MESNKKLIAVLISDVHYNINTIDLADNAMRQATAKASGLKVPLIVAGDLHDTKANLRGECIKRIIDTIRSCDTQVYVIVGNHCLINEKSSEHSLEFLRPWASIVDSPTKHSTIGTLLPYYSDSNKLIEAISNIPKNSRIIMHQGVQTAYMGHYIKDKTSLPKEIFKDYRVISGHYHSRQRIFCKPEHEIPMGPGHKNVGIFDYIGNPYTLNFGEAKDPRKGFVILNSEGEVESIPTNLRKHIIVERDISNYTSPVAKYKPGDLVWMKISGPESQLKQLSKTKIGDQLFGHTNFKLDLIPEANHTFSTFVVNNFSKNSCKPEDILDVLIDQKSESEDHKTKLKVAWRELME